MSEPRADWGLAVAARLTYMRSGGRVRPRVQPRSELKRPTGAQIVDAMARGEFASEFAGRKILLSMIGRLVGLAMVAMVIAILAGLIGEHVAESALRIVEAGSGAGAIFAVALAIILDRRWRQMAASGVYLRRRSTLLLPLTLGVLTAAFLVAA